MAINNIATGVRNGMCDFFVDALDAGAGAGILQSFTAAFATQLATNTFSDPAFGAAAAGVATAGAISDDVSADASGTAAVLRMRDSTPATVAEGTIGAGSGDLNMNTVAWTAGDRIHVNDFATITMPAS